MFIFVLQVLLGIMVGASFQPEMLKMMGKIILPVITSTLFLVGAGLILSMKLTITHKCQGLFKVRPDARSRRWFASLDPYPPRLDATSESR